MRIAFLQFSENNHFNNPNFAGTKISTDKTEFLNKVNELVNSTELKDGFAPFVKHLFIENFTGCKAGVVEVTDDNVSHLKCEYKARQEGELPVLGRYFDSSDVEVPQAPFLDIILYNKEQLSVEGIEIEEDYGIVAVKAEMTPEESPPVPVTIFRNAIGVDEGGNGLKLDHDAYKASVAYWDRFATVK